MAAVAFSDTENPSSPDNADNEDTPEPQRDLGEKPLPASVTQFRGTSSKPGALRRLSNSFTLPASWTRSRNDARSGGAMMLRRTQKRKRPRFDEIVRMHEYESESEADYSPYRDAGRHSRRAISQSNRGTLPPQSLGAVPAFFAFIHNHPDLPGILSSYGQTLLTWFLIGVLVFLVSTCWSVVRADVDLAVQEAAAEIVREVGRCAEEFRRNGCGAASGPPPALAMACREWDDCMRQDPLAVGRARVGARTFTRILNGFFEGMSWKLLACIGLLLVLVAVNARALVPPFMAGGNGAGISHPQQPLPEVQRPGFYHPNTSFDTPFFAPPMTPGGTRRRSPERRALYMAEDPGEGMVMRSPSKGSPRKLGYI
jgi:Di-sulfide bridge nucleocytoplasmic transport domain